MSQGTARRSSGRAWPERCRSTPKPSGSAFSTGLEDHFAMIDVGDGAVKLAFLSDPDGTGLYLCEAAQPL